MTEYLATSENDGQFEARFKRSLEGLLLGAFTESFFQAVRVIKYAKIKPFFKNVQTRSPYELKAEVTEVKAVDSTVDKLKVDTIYFIKQIDGIEIINGKIGGKIPIDDFQSIRNASIHNSQSSSMTLGKYTPLIENSVENFSKAGTDSYIARAGKDSTYFDLGSKLSTIKNKYNLTDNEMFRYFNVPALDDAVAAGKVIQFSHNPLLYPDSFLSQEWQYLKSAHGFKRLQATGDFWIAK